MNNKIMSLPPLDYSYRGIMYIEDIRFTRPRKGLKPYRRSDTGRFWGSTFRLNNNSLVTVRGIYDTVQQVGAVVQTTFITIRRAFFNANPFRYLRFRRT